MRVGTRRTCRLGLVAALAAALAAVGACVTPASTFACERSDQCTVGGTCQPSGYCSFPDSTCPSGQRYSDVAGDGLAGVCVGGGGDVDADPTDPDADRGADARPCDAPFVASTHGCHAFLQPTSDVFDGGRAICIGMAADLPVVETIEESDYIAAMALGANTVDRALIGLERRAGNWRWVDGAPLTLMHWSTGEPGETEPCAVIRNDGFWAGRSCLEAFFVVCER